MKRFLDYLLFPVFIFFTVLTVVIWHPIIVFSRHLSKKMFKRSVAHGNGLLLLYLRLVGTRIRFTSQVDIPENVPLILVSNHQSLYDIPLHVWYFRTHSPKFVAKKELSHNFPSASYTLRNDGSALIDRKDSVQALAEIERLGELIEQEKSTACIFPEGTRSRDGAIKKLRPAGILALLEKAPSAAIVPVAIDGSWQITRYNLLPVPSGIDIQYKILKPVLRQGQTNLEMVKQAWQQIEEELTAS